MNQILQKLHYDVVNRPVDFSVGDTVKVHYKIKEGAKERIQIYEGLVIAIQNQGAGKTFTVRRVSFDVGVERIFPLYAPTVEKVEKIRSSKVRRAKLYYLRDKSGKGSRLKEIVRKPVKDSLFAAAQAYKAAKPKAAPAAEAPAAAETPA
ncbi:50S ribosomal protein L19 [Turneriella parva]|uniref:50S ribosomal protein L19 n=1 Tax=Turneriella parva TaxID=29510 RepID=UPI0005A54C24|nr:50S ribosomal protein L19 [Turneriella parva]